MVYLHIALLMVMGCFQCFVWLLDVFMHVFWPHIFRASLRYKPRSGIVESWISHIFSKWFYPFSLPLLMFERSHYYTSLSTLIFANLVDIWCVISISTFLIIKEMSHFFFTCLYVSASFFGLMTVFFCWVVCLFLTDLLRAYLATVLDFMKWSPPAFWAQTSINTASDCSPIWYLLHTKLAVSKNY